MEARYWESVDYLEAEFGTEHMLIEPIVPAGGLVLMHAKRATGKSAAALSLARAICDGKPWLAWHELQQGRVCYVQLDLPNKLQQDRLARVGAHANLSIVSSDRRRVDVFDAVDKQPDWAKKMQDSQPVLVIVDTLRRSHALSENDASTPMLVYDAWRVLCGDDPTIMFLHHDRKDFADANVDEASRGSGGWLDEVDTAIHLRSHRKRLSSLEFTKVRTCDYPPSLPVMLDPETLDIKLRTQLAASPAGVNGLKKPVLSWLADAVQGDMDPAEIRRIATDADQWEGSGGALSDSAYYRWIQKYGEMGLRK